MDLVVRYSGCVSHDPGSHMVTDPLPAFVAEITKRGFVPSANGLITVAGPCPQCTEERRSDLMHELRIADMCGDRLGIRAYGRELRRLALVRA